VARTPVDPSLFRHVKMYGRRPHARYGWVVRLSGPATDAQLTWLYAHRYCHRGSAWIREDGHLPHDRGDAVVDETRP
jgi:hypothetical protein